MHRNSLTVGLLQKERKKWGGTVTRAAPQSLSSGANHTKTSKGETRFTLQPQPPRHASSVPRQHRPLYAAAG